MSGVDWTKPEERDVVRWFRGGMKIRDIAKATDRSPQSVRAKLAKLGELYAPEKDAPKAPNGMALIMAKLALQKEVALAKREMQRSGARPFKGGGSNEYKHGLLLW